MERFNTELSQKTVRAISEYHSKIVQPELNWLAKPYIVRVVLDLYGRAKRVQGLSPQGVRFATLVHRIFG